MNKEKLVIGNYYLVSLHELHGQQKKDVGKLIAIVDNIYLRWSSGRRQKYLIEFVNHVGGHNGLAYSPVSGKEGYCWYVTGNSIIKKLTGTDVITYAL